MLWKIQGIATRSLARPRRPRVREGGTRGRKTDPWMRPGSNAGRTELLGSTSSARKVRQLRPNARDLGFQHHPRHYAYGRKMAADSCRVRMDAYALWVVPTTSRKSPFTGGGHDGSVVS